MGHANVSNLSKLFLKLLYAKGKISIDDAVRTAVERGMNLCASEGHYSDEGMLMMGFHYIVSDLLKALDRRVVPGGIVSDTVITPVSPLSKEQERVLSSWLFGGDWDDEKDEKILGTIQFKFSKGWRKKYKEIPLLRYIEN